jgi:hypothetical protein
MNQSRVYSFESTKRKRPLTPPLSLRTSRPRESLAAFHKFFIRHLGMT